jgi:serine phosphatase RsbU (regulator of sigma subunit)
VSTDSSPNPTQPTWTVFFAAEASFQAQAQSWARQLQDRWAASFAQIEWGTIRTPDDLIRGDTVVLFGPQDQLTLTAEQIREQGRSVTLIDTKTNLTSAEQLQIRLEALLEQEDEVRQLRKNEAYACAQFPALQDADELRRELEAAASFQEDLLPTFPVKSGDMVVHGLWRPSRYLAGDLLRVEPATDGGLVILLCDVMGHGIPAAIGSALLTQSFDHARESSGADAAMILGRMNQDVHRAQHRPGTRAWFASAICAHVAPSGTITVASAGHPQSLILNQDPEAALTIAASGPLLGIDNASEYQASTHQLPEGGKLIFHSDGFESLNRGNNSAQTNVQSALAKIGSNTDAAGLIDQLELHRATILGRTGQTDDLSLLCLERCRENDQTTALRLVS